MIEAFLHLPMFVVLVITVLVVQLPQLLQTESQEINALLVIIALQEHTILQLALQACLILFLEVKMIPSAFNVAVDISVKAMVSIVPVDCVMQVIIVLEVLPRLLLVMASPVEVVLSGIFAQLGPVLQYHALKVNTLMRHTHRLVTCAQQGCIVLAKGLLNHCHVQLVMFAHQALVF